MRVLPLSLLLSLATSPAQAQTVIVRKTGSESAEAKPSPPKEAGHFRHIQWLQTREGHLRYATVGLTDFWVPPEFNARFGSETSTVALCRASGEVEAKRTVPGSLLPRFTWLHRTTWRVLEDGSHTWLAYIDEREKLHVIDFHSGSVRFERAGARDIFDSRVCDGGVELLVRLWSGPEWIRLDDEDGPTSATPLAGAPQHCAAARWPRALDGDTTQSEEWWALGWNEEEFVVASARVRGARASSWKLDLPSPPARDAELRLDVARSADGPWIAVGDPSFDHHLGRIALWNVGERGPDLMFAGRTSPRFVGDSRDQRDLGQTLRMLPDRDGDRVPELVVTGPSASVLVRGTEVVLFSPGRGKVIARHGPGLSPELGHSLDLSPDGQRILIGGAKWRGMPENLTEPGVVTALDSKSLDLIFRSQQ